MGFLEAPATDQAFPILLILTLNNHDVLHVLHKDREPASSLTGNVRDAPRRGAVAVGPKMYLGSARSTTRGEQCRTIVEEAKAPGPPTVVWSDPRGGDASNEGETALGVVAYPAPLEPVGARKDDEAFQVLRETLADRVRHVVQSTFNGRRIVLFLGGPRDDEALLEEARAIRPAAVSAGSSDATPSSGKRPRRYVCSRG